MSESITQKLYNDATVLKSMWFSKAGSIQDHAERLDAFYKPQAQQYDQFRANFLWGRKPMLAACAARLRERTGMVWVDVGGGTWENVDMMSEYISLDKFKHIYVVDLCKSLCEVARAKVKAKGWKNVTVVEADAANYDPGMPAQLVTFSYSLSMIPPFVQAVDKARSYLAPNGLMGVADFYVSSKYDLPMRQMSWSRRFFWRSVFDIDNIDLGPERRQFLDYTMERVWEYNSQGSIPYVPYLRAPFYVWIGRPQAKQGNMFFQGTTASASRVEARVEAPPLFPPTFLYSQSWEDPEPDMKVLEVQPGDTCLTLTSGGCNSLNMLIEGGSVVSVDCNPAQSALLELKAIAARQLSYDDFWLMFGEGKHPRFEELYAMHLAPFMTQTSQEFWNSRMWYFKQGLYYQGGMGKVCWVLQILTALFGMTQQRIAAANAPDLAAQRKVWNDLYIVRLCKAMDKSPFAALFVHLVTIIFLNRLVLWYGAGVPFKQYELIRQDGITIERYFARTLHGVAQHSHVRRHNYFYYNCLMGHFTKDNCPSYLKPDNFAKLKEGGIDRLQIESGTFLDALALKKYSKVILMDHVDWCDDQYAHELASLLAAQVVPGGRVILRSASTQPPYCSILAEHGFKVQCISRAADGYMDRINMYSSFWVATRKQSTD